MRKIVLVLFLAIFIPLVKVEASCTYDEISRLKKIASNVNASYVYNEADGVTFDITLVNLNEEIYFIDTTTLKQYLYDLNEIDILNYRSGEKVTYKFYPVNPDCDEQLLHTISINLPTYNKYYKDNVCVGAENYSLCKKWASHNYDYETFVSKVKEYKSKIKIEDEVVIEPEVPNTMYNVVLDFIAKYYYVVLLILIVISSITIYKLNKKDNIYS